MDPETITAFAREMSITEDLAGMAMSEAGGVLEQARAIVLEMLPKFLFIKIKFLSQKSDGSGGLIFLCAEKDKPGYLINQAIVDSNRDWIRSVVVHRQPEIFQRLFADFFREHKGHQLYDCQKLKDDLGGRIRPADFQFAFDSWGSPGKGDTPGQEGGPDSISAKIAGMFAFILSDLMVQTVDVTASFDLYTTSQFEAAQEALGLVKPEAKEVPSQAAETHEQEEESSLRVTLKGRFMIDPVDGILLSEINVGDKVYCEIVDRSDIAVAVARHIGAYVRGTWYPTVGEVMEFKDHVGDRRQYRLRLSQGVYIDALSFTGFKVRTRSMSFREVALKAREPSSAISFVPLLVAAFIVVILMVSLMMSR
jgi:hypothetical protein